MKKLKLLYRESRDGLTAKAFHDKYDSRDPTIVLYRNSKDFVFWGYSIRTWEK